MVFCPSRASGSNDQFYKKEIERSVSLILGSLDHLRHSFISLYQSVITRDGNKEKYDIVELIAGCSWSVIKKKELSLIPSYARDNFYNLY